MTEKEFVARAVRLFGEWLSPLGFTNQGSVRATFYRTVSAGDVAHFIWTESNSSGTTFQVRVFPSSPSIDPLFERRLPDRLGVPTDRWSSLSNLGVGPDQSNFRCRTDEGLSRAFRSEVVPLLERFAIPYLDQFKRFEDVIPFIRHPLYLGFALWNVGSRREAAGILQKERDWLLANASDDEDMAITIRKIDDLLRPA